MTVIATPGLERRLKSEAAGEVLFDRFTRGRYATDASIYQCLPLAVLVPPLIYLFVGLGRRLDRA